MSKYKNVKTTYKGITFDSRKEAERYIVLKSLQDRGLITDLKRQVRFQLLPAQKVNGKVVEKSVAYVADFTYMRNGELVVEDAKGMRTPVYNLKKKLMVWFYSIQIKEV